MNVQHSTFNFQLLKKYALEVIASVWLVLVAVEYISRYYLGNDIDLSIAYIGMLAVTVLAAVWKTRD